MDKLKLTEYPTPLPMLERDEKGMITHGIAQDTNKNGRAGKPCKYCSNKEDIQKRITEYFDKCKPTPNGKLIIPYIEELAMELDVDDQTLVNWAEKEDENGEPEHPEYFEYFKKLKTLQKLRLKQRVLGRFNPTGAIYLLKSVHGVIETEKRVIAGDKAEPLQIEIIEEKKNE